MQKYEARPKGGLTSRHKKALRDAGFSWEGSAWIRIGPGPRPWGCTVRRWKAPALGRKDAWIGILVGTHDQYGKKIPRQE